MKRILILGASGTFGKALVEKLSNDKECHLTLASRHASAFYHESERCHVIDCDAMKTDDLQQAMTSCHVVYCSISGDNLPIIVENTVSAMKKAGLRRLIFMGAVGIYDEIPADMDDEDNVKNNPDQIPNRKAADIVENSGLDYTILRPPKGCGLYSAIPNAILGVRFVILLPGFVCMVGEPHRSAMHAISFYHC